MPIEKLIEILQRLRPDTIVLDCSVGIFDHRHQPLVDGHLKEYDGWQLSTLRIATPPAKPLPKE